MKKLLDQSVVNKTTEVCLQNHITLDNKPSLEKGSQPFKKMQYSDPKQEKARPLNYINKFPLPKPVFTFEVSRQRS